MWGEQNLKKYQDESTKVSKVSVSLITSSLLIFVYFHVWWWSNGLPLQFISTSLGKVIGKSFIGIGIISPFFLYTIWIGQPQ